MNKRIKELAEQATTYRDQGPGVLSEFDEELFAKLLVEECLTVVNSCIGRRIGEINLDILLKDHFGMK